MKLQRLKELALGATQGGWKTATNDCHAGQIATLHGDDDGYQEVWSEEWFRGISQNANAAYIAAACPANILPILESYEELLAASKGYLDNSVSDIGRQGRQAHGALLQAITNAEKLSQ